MKKYFAELALLFATVIWGGTFVIVKNSVEDMSPMFFVAIRFSVAVLVLMPFAIKRLRGINKAVLLQSIFLGILLFLSFATQTAGLKTTSATKSAFITGLTVVFIPLFQIVVEKRKPTPSNVIGSLIVLIGLLFLSSKNTSIDNLLYELGNDFNFGDFLTVICAAVFALQVVYLDTISKKIDFIALTFIQILTCSILGLLTTGIFDSVRIESIHFDLTNSLVIGLLYTSLLATVITLNIQSRYQKRITPTKAGIIYSFEPVFASIFAYFMLSERISTNGIVGGTLIFAGLIISEVIDFERLLKKGLKDYDEKDILEEIK